MTGSSWKAWFWRIFWHWWSCFVGSHHAIIIALYIPHSNKPEIAYDYSKKSHSALFNSRDILEVRVYDTRLRYFCMTLPSKSLMPISILCPFIIIMTRGKSGVTRLCAKIINATQSVQRCVGTNFCFAIIMIMIRFESYPPSPCKAIVN